MAKIIDFFTRKEIVQENSDYANKLEKMDIFQLLKESESFDAIPPNNLTREDINDGILLYSALEKAASTQELKKQCSAYQHTLRTLLNA